MRLILGEIEGCMSEIKQQFGHDDFELIERESCYQGFFKLQRFHFRHRRFDGSWSREVTREIFVRGNATCVLPYDPVEGCVVLLEQFRVASILETQSPWLIELIAGINEEGEQPEEVARRESKEEADLELGEMRKICEYLVSPGGTTEKVALFCARVNCKGVGGVFGLEAEDEDIKVHVVKLEEALEMVSNGLINNAAAIIALQWLALNKESINTEWL